jgi:hypothetical protein
MLSEGSASKHMGTQGVPRGTKILCRARRRSSRVAVREIREPSRSLRLQVHVLEASSERQIEIAFETLKQKPVGALQATASSQKAQNR